MSKKQNKQSINPRTVVEADSVVIKFNNLTETQQKDFEAVKSSPVFIVLVKKTIEGKVIKPNNQFSLNLFNSSVAAVIEQYHPKISEDEDLKITNKTMVNLEMNRQEHKEIKKQEYLQFGSFYTTISDIINLQLLDEESLVFGIKGLLITAEKGNGKSSLLNRLAEDYVNKVTVLKAKTDKIDMIYKSIEETHSPLLILIDDLSHDDKSILNKIKNIFTQYTENNFIVIAATLNDDLKELKSITGSGMFEKTLDISLPNKTERKYILSSLLNRLNKNNKDLTQEFNEKLTLSDQNEGLFDEAVLESIALKTSGFVFQDLISLCREIELLLKNKETKLTLKSVALAFENARLANLQSITSQVAKQYYSDIGGYEEVKNRIKAVVELPLKKPEIFLNKGIKPSKGILLYGPPGCSKTMFARAIATESNFNFISVKGPEVFNKYVGSSEKKIREIFRKARFCAPSIIFFDEIDAIASKRDKKTDVGERILTQLLTEMDGAFQDEFNSEMSKGGKIADNMVVVVAATNRPEMLDSAILRPGRFDELIYIGLPNKTAVEKIFELNTKNMTLENINKEEIVNKLIGYSGAEIVQVCRESAMQSIYSGNFDDKINGNDFNKAMERIRKRIDKTTLMGFEKFSKNERSLF